MKKDLESLEIGIAKLLRVGVLVAGLFILIGWITQIDFAHNAFVHFHTYQASDLRQVLRDLWERGQWGLLTAYFGFFLLIALPFTRVLLTAFLFLRQRDFWLAGIAIVVLFGLLLSFSLGFEI